MDLSSLIQSAPQLLRDLPFLMNTAQLIFYSGLVLTFGGIIMRAYSGYLSVYLRVVLRLVFGFLALVCGMGISWIIPYFSDVPIYMIMQDFLNVIPAGLIATIVLYATLRMISYNVFNIAGIEKGIRRLEELKERAGKVERKENAGHRHGIRHPVRLAGLAGFAAFLVIGLVGFQGFPDILTALFAELGFTPETLGQLSGECAGALSLYDNQDSLTTQPYTNPSVEAMIEEYTGENVTQMYIIETEDGFYISTFTQNQACLSTTDIICACQQMESS